MALCLSVHQVTLFLSPHFPHHSTCSPCTEQSSHDGEQTQSVFVSLYFASCYDTRINDLHEVCTVSGHLNHFKTELTLLLLMMLQTETRLIFISKRLYTAKNDTCYVFLQGVYSLYASLRYCSE